MKRFLALTILLCLCVSMTGCRVLDYAKAAQLYKKEEYAQALELYQSLGDYADSEKMVLLCNQKLDYKIAGRHFVLGQYEEALELYEGLDLYADSAVKAIECRYALGMQCYAQQDYEKAIFWLSSLGNYENSMEIADLARWQWLRQEEHVYVVEETADAYRAIRLGPTNEDALYVYLKDSGTLLGIDYVLEFALLLEKDRDEADFWVCYASEGETGIEEKAGGTVALSSFRSGGPMQVEYFRQRIDAWGESYYSEDVTDSTVIQSMLADAQTQINAYLPKLLEKTGVEITPEDLGL